MAFTRFIRRRRASSHRGPGAVALRLAALATVASVGIALPKTSGAAHAAASPAAKGPFVVGVSNNLVGNGWREELICSAKAEATASHGLVMQVLVSAINGIAAGMKNTG